MGKIIALIVLLFAAQVHATPILYDLTGAKTSNGYGTLYGSVVYDPDTKLLWDHAVAVVYSANPTFFDNQMNKIVNIPITGEASVNLYITPIAGVLMVVDVKNGKSVWYPDAQYTQAKLGTLDWFNSGFAVRANSIDCQGCAGIRPYGNWEPSIYMKLLNRTTPTASVPEPSSLLFLLTAIPLWAGYKYLPKLRRANS